MTTFSAPDRSNDPPLATRDQNAGCASMPMTLTHAMVPLVGTLAFGTRPFNWRLIGGAIVAAVIPDVDSLGHHFLGIQPNSIYGHRGAAHSLFVAIVAGLVAAAFHNWFRARALTAGVGIAAAMASHCVLDMMTDSGLPVACVWPLSSARLFADWRPIHSVPIHRGALVAGAISRLQSEWWQLVIPLIALALAFRLARTIMPGVR